MADPHMIDAKHSEVSTLAPQHEKKDLLEFAKSAFDNLSESVTGGIADTAVKLGDLAEKGTIRFLLAFGGALVAISLVTKVEISGFHVAKTEPREFISMLVVGGLLIIAGVAFDFYTYHREMNIYEEDQRANRERSRLAADVAQTGMRTLAGIGETIGTAVRTSVEGINQGQGQRDPPVRR